MIQVSRAGEVYVYPACSSGNEYIARTRRVIAGAGFSVFAMPKLPGLAQMLGRRYDCAVLNWFEDRLSGDRNLVLEFFKALLFLILVRLIFRKVVWVRHNLKPHGRHNRKLYRLLIKLLSVCVDETVTHRKVDGIESKIINHPLYSPLEVREKCDRDIDFLYFGVVSRYKGLEELLDNWPVDVNLMMTGKSDDASLTQRLKDIIRNRGLRVEWNDAFIEHDELNTLIGRSNCVILPHLNNSMIVSGAFFHAISLGAKVIVRDGEFYKEMSKELPFCRSFNITNIGADLREIQLAPYPSENCLTKYTDESISSQWKEILSDS